MKKNSKFKIQNSKFSNQRGVALVAVLWVFIFLFVVAFDFSASVREEGTAASRYSEETQGYYLALAGLEDTLYSLMSQPAPTAGGGSSPPADLFDGSWRDGSVGAGRFRVRMTDEAGKINLNRVDEATLRIVFANLGIEEPRRSVLVDSILDWRDDDELHRLNGAESDYYRTLSPPYTAKNGPFDSVEELLWVQGMTSELFNGAPEGGAEGIRLREIFTVDSPTDRVNLRTAPAEVIHALTGLPLEKCREIVEARKALSEKTLGDMLKLLGVAAGDDSLRRFVFINPSVVTIEAAGRRESSSTERQVRAVVRLLGAQRGAALVRWLDRDAVVAERSLPGDPAAPQG
jgi:general secretion pathway protein K